MPIGFGNYFRNKRRSSYTPSTMNTMNTYKESLENPNVQLKPFFNTIIKENKAEQLERKTVDQYLENLSKGTATAHNQQVHQQQIQPQMQQQVQPQMQMQQQMQQQQPHFQQQPLNQSGFMPQPINNPQQQNFYPQNVPINPVQAVRNVQSPQSLKDEQANGAGGISLKPNEHIVWQRPDFAANQVNNQNNNQNNQKNNINNPQLLQQQPKQQNNPQQQLQQPPNLPQSLPGGVMLQPLNEETYKKAMAELEINKQTMPQKAQASQSQSQIKKQTPPKPQFNDSSRTDGLPAFGVNIEPKKERRTDEPSKHVSAAENKKEKDFQALSSQAEQPTFDSRLTEYIQNETNGATFYNYLSGIAPSGRYSSILSEISSCCLKRAETFNHHHTAKNGEAFVPRNIEINKSLKFADALEFAIDEESTTLRELCAVYEKEEDANKSKLLSSIIVKKMVDYGMLCMMKGKG